MWLCWGSLGVRQGSDEGRWIARCLTYSIKNKVHKCMNNQVGERIPLYKLFSWRICVRMKINIQMMIFSTPCFYISSEIWNVGLLSLFAGSHVDPVAGTRIWSEIIYCDLFYFFWKHQLTKTFFPQAPVGGSPVLGSHHVPQQVQVRKEEDNSWDRNF